MDVNLVLFKKDGSKKDFPLERKKTIIGRSHTCALKIPLLSVSKKHCQITTNSDTLTVTDLKSRNGIKVNGKAVSETRLNPGDTLKIGPLVFVLQINGEPGQIENPAKAEKQQTPETKTKPAKQPPPPEEEEIDFDNLDELGDDDLGDLDDLDDVDEELNDKSDEKEAV